MNMALICGLQNSISHVSASVSIIEASNKPCHLRTQIISAAYAFESSEKYPIFVPDNIQLRQSGNHSFEINNVETTRALHVP